MAAKSKENGYVNDCVSRKASFTPCGSVGSILCTFSSTALAISVVL